MEIISVNKEYASALSRLMAFVIDRLALSVITNLVFQQLLGLPFEINTDTFWVGVSAGSGMLAYTVLREMAILAYFSGMESSKYRATLGKIVMGIQVTDYDRAPITFARAMVRNLSKYLSAIILGIGYIMIIFDTNKQGLHDKIAETIVVRS